MIEAEAASWLAREDRGLGAEERAQLEAWLNGATENKVAFLVAKAAWDGADRLSVLRAPAASASDFAKRRYGRVGVGIGAFAAIAASLLLLASDWHGSALHPAAQDYATDIGVRQTVRLAEGVKIELNTQTRLHVDVTPSRRMVVLDAGEAFFEVTHDPVHPFTVLAGGKRITDVGTKFSVMRNGNDVRVVVMEGRVRVDSVAREDDPTVVASSNDVVLAKADSTLVVQRSAQQIQNALDWRDGVLVFSQERLADVAVEFNRYNRKKLVVEGAARELRIGGNFRADDIESFAHLTSEGFGLRMADTSDEIVLSDKRVETK